MCLKICGIYKITSPSKKVYIGKSVNVFSRWSDYRGLRCKQQVRLYHSLKKYGWEKHKFEILCQCGKSELNNLEIYYIELYQCFNSEFGLNLQGGGIGGKMSNESRSKISKSRMGVKNPMFGKKHSLEHRRKISESNKGRIGYWKGKKKTEEQIAKQRGRVPWNKGKKTDYESIQKRKDTIIKNGGTINGGFHFSEENKMKLRHKFSGRKITDEQKVKMSIAAKKRPPMSDEQKEKIRKSRIGKKASEETKKKLSVINKGKIISEEQKEKIRRANIGKKRTDEARKKMSDAHKGVKLSKEHRDKVVKNLRHEKSK